MNHFSRKHPRVGSVLYLAASIQFFAAQILAAWQWPPPYNQARDTISDTGRGPLAGQRSGGVSLGHAT
jgi:DNA-binding transcriptional regulator of glucitol operon